MVPGAGIEPAHGLPIQDFESCASTNSAIPAQGLLYNRPLEKPPVA